MVNKSADEVFVIRPAVGDFTRQSFANCSRISESVVLNALN
jgi:hypothetical protein